MTNIPDGAKRPDDHQKPDDDLETVTFNFTHKGKTFQSKPFVDVISPGWLRSNRRRDETDFMFTLLEALFKGQPKALGALDDMDWKTFNATAKEMLSDMESKAGVTLGE